ncbi:MAG TPA: hypothetical protein VK707_02000 [Solirubrobacteraceae bacterium]|jgi:hypothetical protein|nr:hypothetical protein [Solirubrobacteraceae bacterium]
MLHALLCLLPVAAVVLPLLARRYPGERLLLAAHRERRRRLPRALLAAASHGRQHVVAVHGRELIARSLAVRPPPAALVAS